MSVVGTDRSESVLRILVIEDERKLAGAIAEGKDAAARQRTTLENDTSTS